ncbi:hypothetical protein LMH73_020565 [Vibrio splendidus]|nr:hypothetical protein [Vibrio splendidus]MCC4880512.1 hypothetical protein [Vibrio splendidus]
MALKYNKVCRQSERGIFLSLAVPYGGHLVNTELRPPLYEIKPDVLIVSGNFQQLLITIKKFLRKGKTVYCHPVVQDGFWGWDVDEMKQTLLEIISSEKYKRENLVILPASASLFTVDYIKDFGEEVTHYTPFFDYGDSDKTLLKDEFNKELLAILRSIGREEKMIWTTKELPGSWISTLWSKRVITPKHAYEV